MTQDDYQYLSRWIKDGWYENGDYSRLQPLLTELLNTAGDMLLDEGDSRLEIQAEGQQIAHEDDTQDGY